MSRLRVLHVLEAIEGGTARHVTDLVTHVTGVDHVVVVPAERVGGYTDRDAVPAMRRAGADVRIVDMRRSVSAPQNVLALAAVAGLVKSDHPDVVHGHSSIGGVVARLAARRVKGTACVWTPNGVLTARPVVAIERTLARLTDRIIAVSPSERDLLARLRIGRPGQVQVVPNGIELVDPSPTPDLRELCGVAPGTPLVGCVGRLAPQKGIDVFLDACRLVADEVPDAHFLLVADGPQSALVRERTAGWSRFTWLTGLPEARRLLGQLDVFVLLSRYEGAPYTPLEAMWAGAMVVLTDVVGNRDAVDATWGVLVPPENPVTAAAAIIRLLRHPDPTLVAAGRQRIADHFAVDVIARATEKIYDEVSARPRFSS